MQKATLILVLLFLSCAPKTAKILDSKTEAIPLREHSVQAVNWQQTSGEYRALAYQAYHLAKLSLDHILQKTHGEKPLAIVTDIDETVLDNSPYNAKLIEEDKEYNSTSWKAWGLLKQAEAVPGAKEFFNYAVSKNVAVFYISNRKVNQVPETLKNLKAHGFPMADEEHILLRGKVSGKEPRRKQVEKSHKIVMLLGDNLSDFAAYFDDASMAKRNALTDENSALFGTKFIVLPNPMYGDWENKGIYKGRYNWSPAQKDSLRKAALKSY